jgi:hypothetical protein
VSSILNDPRLNLGKGASFVKTPLKQLLKPEGRSMRAVVLVLLLSGASVGLADEKKEEPVVPIPLEKWGFDSAVKTWGMKVKKCSYDLPTLRAPAQYTFVVEFTKDLTGEELAALKKALNGAWAPKTLAVFFFDKDMVLITRTADYDVISEMTGVKGDAFQLVVSRPTKDGKPATEVSKVDLRPPK